MENKREMIDRAIELEQQARAIKIELDGIKAKLQAEALAEMENRNTKFVEYFGSTGSVFVSYKEKFEVDNLPALKEIFGDVLTGKVKTEETVKITLDNKIKSAVMALYKGEYGKWDLSHLLAGMGLDQKQIKAALKKLKGDYWKDIQTLRSFGIDPESDIEEELDAIREQKNLELIMKFVDPSSVDLEKLRRAVSIEESLSVGLIFELEGDESENDRAEAD